MRKNTLDVLLCSRGLVSYDRPGRGLKDIASVGFEHIMLDLSGLCSPWELECWGMPEVKRGGRVFVSEDTGLLVKRAAAIASAGRAERLSFSAAKAPHLKTDTKRSYDEMEALMDDLIRKSITACSEAGCRYLILRSNGRDREWFMDIAGAAVDSNVMLLLQNEVRNVNGRSVRGFCSDPVEATALINGLNDSLGCEVFGLCYDVVAANICGMRNYEYISAVGAHIKAVVVSDSSGEEETALLPFTARSKGINATDWRGIIRGLREISFDGELIFDISDTTSAFSPLLKRDILALAKKTADFIAWQIGLESILARYDKRVLFGAGNMCREYMNNYGEKYPPLFTCDNNSALWGTQFEGLTVKSPSCLKEIPTDVCIVICNMYYREIEEQLKGMGLNNPIEYFNDEYLSKYHPDRIDPVTRLTVI